MTIQIDELKKSKRLLLEKEYEFLTALGLKPGAEPSEAQRVEVLGKLYEVVRHRLSSELQDAIKSAQARAGNHPHPIDAMEVALVEDMDPEARLFWEATHKPHVMTVRRPVIRD